MDAAELRDWVIIIGLGALSLVVFVVLLAYLFVGLRLWRVVRTLNRLTEAQFRARILRFNGRTRELLDEDALTLANLSALAVDSVQRVRERRRRKPRRFAAVRDGLAQVRGRLPIGR